MKSQRSTRGINKIINAITASVKDGSFYTPTATSTDSFLKQAFKGKPKSRLLIMGIDNPVQVDHTLPVDE